MKAKKYLIVLILFAMSFSAVEAEEEVHDLLDSDAKVAINFVGNSLFWLMRSAVFAQNLKGNYHQYFVDTNFEYEPSLSLILSTATLDLSKLGIENAVSVYILSWIQYYFIYLVYYGMSDSMKSYSRYLPLFAAMTYELNSMAIHTFMYWRRWIQGKEGIQGKEV